jgi:chromosome segregation ATPase
MPEFQPGAFSHDNYLRFRNDVVSYRTAIQIRYGKRTKSFSVRLDATAKRTIHHYLAQIRELLTELPMEDRKRQRLFDKLAAFQNEVDRDRTRFESFAAAIVELGDAIGEGSQKAEPLRRLLSSIARVIHGSKEEKLKELRRPVERKQIEPPGPFGRSTGPKPPTLQKSLAEDLDDEIPF